MSSVIKEAKKRDGRVVPFDKTKIAEAIFKAAKSVGGKKKDVSNKLADKVIEILQKKFAHRIPGIENIQDVVEKVLIEEGCAKTAKAYILYRDKRARIRQLLKVHKEIRGQSGTTDLSLLVAAPSRYEISPWDKSKITLALVKEAKVPHNIAEKIARSVEEKIIATGLKKLTTSLIREFVDIELLTHGFNNRLKSQQVIGMSIYDLRELIYSKSQENSNISANNPEAINLSIAENTLKQYLLEEVFTEDVSTAHLTGLIHIHDLGYPRIYCSSHSVEYLKKYGLVLDNLGTSSAPAKHARTLTGHLNTYLASMQAYYAGALGIGFLNILYAPFLQGMSYEEMKQEAQYLLFSGSQNAFSRGGQSLFLDANIHLGVPDYLKDVTAIGSGGKYLDKTYGKFENESQMFARALIEVWKEGDRDGHPFSFPKCDLHINAQSFSDPKQYELFKFACEAASYNGSPYFVFDRGNGATLSQCFTENTKVLIKNSNKYVYENISQVYDLIKGQEEIEGLEYWKVPPKDYYRTLSINNDGETNLVYIKQMLRRKYEGKICNVKLEDGTEISVTPDHPFFVLKNGLLIRKRADELTEKDFVPINKVTKPKLDDTPITEIDLMGEAWKQKNDKIEAVFDESLHLKTKYINEKYQISKDRIKHWNSGWKEKYRYPAWLLYNEGIYPSNAKLIYRYGHTKFVRMPSKIYLSPRIGRFLGLYLAEGYTNKTSVSFSLSRKEKELANFISRTVRDVFGSNIWFDDSKKWESRKVVTSSKILAWFISLFIKGGSARNKELTSLMFNVTEEFKKSFIKGFLEGDGYTRQGSTTVEVTFHLGSSGLSRDIKALLRNLGINSTIRKALAPNPRNRKQMLDSYHVRIANTDLKKVGWGLPYKGENPSDSHSLWRLLPAKEMGINWDEAGGILKYQLRRASRNHLDYFEKYYPQNEWSKKVNNGMHFLKVKEVSHADYDGYVYDFEVDDEKHGFLLPEGIYGSNCCRLRTKVSNPEMLRHPESMRFCGFQNVTINLPQCAYRVPRCNIGVSKENINKVFEEVNTAMELAMKAHLEKKKFIGRLMSAPGTPLWQIGKNACDGKPYVDLEKATYIIGIIGLNECVQYLTGKQLHEDDEAFNFGMKIISFMYLKTHEFQKKYKLHIALEESPAESAARRLAKVDLREFPQSKEVVKGDIKNDTHYYTNSIHFAASAPVNFIDRIIKQSKFHPIIESGAIIHAFVGESKPSAQSIENLVRKTWENTQCAQLTISPEFTICNDCAKMDRGINGKCKYCGSENTYGITRIVGYFSKVNNWNKSKLAELKDRQKAVQHYQFG
ncbi:hypothetical protein AUJ66_05600 [Candidatus Desantisbacteria bacterium CG1_02_38_46]|uniref:Uncharacterized protein n=3 Tax=unclassified Candidatus Desantisiibacteriota TaxID=3106372 RepID=A0A2H9PBY5_9BACT|nr:MAG: hypothetical protein AUJ66_05600 [Candidatus Desantisbacteria bacterium CG1_02_38_46]PIU51775.1 MAG: hypothetical protein COS91_02705 [Candidatus Desantisbacteria bacterium CG07_land_8_20_14_0_80_39_15]PIZ16500.1 MAG: hypothetical protein COY51_02555 [Candidatus Desantisbacteria bacterium CG_4_10_14_0_8_um_filter_39_17]